MSLGLEVSVSLGFILSVWVVYRSLTSTPIGWPIIPAAPALCPHAVMPSLPTVSDAPRTACPLVVVGGPRAPSFPTDMLHSSLPPDTAPRAPFPPIIHYRERHTATLCVCLLHARCRGQPSGQGTRHAWGPRSAGARLLYGAQWCPPKSCPPRNDWVLVMTGVRGVRSWGCGGGVQRQEVAEAGGLYSQPKASEDASDPRSYTEAGRTLPESSPALRAVLVLDFRHQTDLLSA